MKKTEYFSEGLLPYTYIETSFEKLGKVQKGNLKSAMERVAKEMWLTYETEFYRYTYELEGYINSIVARQKDKEFSLQKILEIAVYEYFLEVFHDNVYTFLEHYIRRMLAANGIQKVKEGDVYSLIGYVEEDKYNISDMKRRVIKYVCKQKAF